MENIKKNRVIVFIVVLVTVFVVWQGVAFPKALYLIKRNRTKINIERILPNHIAGYPVPYEIYIPNFWGDKYKRFNEKYGRVYGRKVLGGYDYSSASILAIIFKGVKVVDERGRKVEFLPKIIRQQLMYAVAEPSRVNNLLYNVIRNYIVNDFKGGIENNSIYTGGSY